MDERRQYFEHLICKFCLKETELKQIIWVKK